MVKLHLTFDPNYYDGISLGYHIDSLTLLIGNKVQIIARESQYQFVDNDPHSCNFSVNRAEVKRIEAWVE